jgi:beta-glucosidase-like glycosyl hydrolase
VPSEDPTLSSKYATQFVRGMQEGALYPKYLKTIATCKHFR